MHSDHKVNSASAGIPALQKAATHVPGFDEITVGGLPRARTTLVLGGPGAGKTVFALQSLVNAAANEREPGIFVAFEESSAQIIANASTFGWDLPSLERERLFFLDAKLSPSVVQVGDFDLTAMLATLEHKANEMQARRIVFDGLDVLLTLLADSAAERREVFRLYEWLQRHNLTGVITAKTSVDEHRFAERYSFMQFMVDCVVLLRHELLDRVTQRSLRVTKYRGSGFAENEFPMIIGPEGVEVSTFGHAELGHNASTERVSSGVERLDHMMGGGYFRGSSVLITGAPGTAKTTLAASFAAGAAARGERVLYLSFDESVPQIVRNLRSVGIDIAPWLDAGVLQATSLRTESRSADEHLLDLRGRMRQFAPRHLILDPISALTKTGGQLAASHASLRLLDYARSLGVTVVCTSLTFAEDAQTEVTSTQISTIADTWIHLAYVVQGGERNRTLTIVKSRGTKHSNQVRELVLGDHGVTLTDVYTAGGAVLVGTARYEREAQAAEEQERRQLETAHRRAIMELAEAEIDARIAVLERERAARRANAELQGTEFDHWVQQRTDRVAELRRRRGGDADLQMMPLLERRSRPRVEP
jgi:circadian clock protein KaiC